MDRHAIRTALLWSLFIGAMMIVALVMLWRFTGPWPYIVALLFAGGAFRRSLRSNQRKTNDGELR